MTLPVGARRLFPEDLAVPPDSEFVLERLCEEGDSADLRWLVTQHDERTLGDWFARLGGRRLSRRSRAFWTLVLDRQASVEPPLTRELWPL